MQRKEMEIVTIDDKTFFLLFVYAEEEGDVKTQGEMLPDWSNQT